MWPDVVLGVYVAAFSVGTISHVLDIFRWGIRPHNQYHWTFNLFWTSLALFDPVAIVLVLRRQRAGLLLAGLIMILDVAVNVTAGLHEYLGTGRFLMWGLYTQVPFAIFLLATAPSLWNAFGRDGPPSNDMQRTTLAQAMEPRRDHRSHGVQSFVTTVTEADDEREAGSLRVAAADHRSPLSVASELRSANDEGSGE
jgi:hypothetical protein